MSPFLRKNAVILHRQTKNGGMRRRCIHLAYTLHTSPYALAPRLRNHTLDELISKQVYMKSIRRKILTVELFELVELGGIDLKVFILIKNAERAVTAKELEETLGLLPGFSADSLRHLTELYFIERTRNGRYRAKVFPYDGARRPTEKG